MTPSDAWKNIQVIILDVDGVLTDGRLGYGAPELIKFFNVRDGHWIKLAMRAGFKAGIITGRVDEASRRRAEDLGMDFYIEGAKDKLAAFENLKKDLGISDSQCMYIGDDVIDMPVMRRAGVAVAVADGMPELDEVALWRTKTKGGQGAVCEAIHRLLQEQNKLDAVMERYRR